eukprot:CAMPEP_0197246604 /NCGR_PEP_ID=MMETSP1429-20130617/17906_1 /TAXON_ID=49237 /ORGANISM="Chaetoceros  sp., Strain UNC1202" /LENGTH=102 /DNA_ID=CAMNT_0042707303 /DNA_START=37 /DNA_END=345 /DNA_ORIENTATION=+
MKTFQTIALIFAAVVACASAFSTPSPNTKPAFKAAVIPQAEAKVENNNAAAVAAFATAMAPFAAHATEVDEATVIGYGAGLVACVVSLAVGFSIGYGTLVKP